MQISEKKAGILLSYVTMAVNVAIKFLYTPLLIRQLGQSEYGLYSLVISIVGYLAILNFGFGSAATRYIVKFKSENNKKDLYRLYSTLSLIYLIIGFVALFVCIGINLGADALFGNAMTNDEVSKLRIMIILCGVNLLFSFPMQISSSVLVAYEKFKFKNGVNLIKLLLEPIVVIALLFSIKIRSIGVIVIVTGFNLLGYLSYYIFAVKKLDFKFSIKSIYPPMIKSLIGFSVWMFLLMLFEQLQFNTGQFVLGVSEGTSAVAVWGVVMIFVMNYRSLSTAISNVFSPSLMSSVYENRADFFKSESFKMSRLQLLILSFILFNFAVFGYDFIRIWAGEDYAGAFMPALIIMIPMMLSMPLDFSYIYQMATNKLQFRVVSLFSAFILSFIVIWAVDGININSFAWIMSVSIFVGQGLCVLYYLRRHMEYNLRLILLDIAKIIIVPLFVCIIGCLIYNNYFPQISDVLKLVLGVLVYNSFLIPSYWFFSMNSYEKQLILKHK